MAKKKEKANLVVVLGLLIFPMLILGAVLLFTTGFHSLISIYWRGFTSWYFIIYLLYVWWYSMHS